MKAPKNFEDGIARLEDVLARMQSADTSLADSVKLYAEAAQLLNYCRETLDKAELQITEIDAKLAHTSEKPDAAAEGDIL